MSEKQENKHSKVHFLSLIITLLLFCTAWVFLGKDGYARDSGIYVEMYLVRGLWILLVISIIEFILFAILYRMKGKRIINIIIFFLTLTSLIFGLTVAIGWAISYEQNKYSEIDYEKMTTITLEELEDIIVGNSSLTNEFDIVYIGRDNCPLCEYILPDFVNLLDEKNLNLLYYNTRLDRDVRPDEMNHVLKLAQIYGVPYVMVIKENRIAGTFTGEHLVDELEDYLD